MRSALNCLGPIHPQPGTVGEDLHQTSWGLPRVRHGVLIWRLPLRVWQQQVDPDSQCRSSGHRSRSVCDILRRPVSLVQMDLGLRDRVRQLAFTNQGAELLADKVCVALASERRSDYLGDSWTLGPKALGSARARSPWEVWRQQSTCSTATGPEATPAPDTDLGRTGSDTTTTTLEAWSARREAETRFGRRDRRTRYRRRARETTTPRRTPRWLRDTGLAPTVLFPTPTS
jgi:hypothetical protein